MTYDKANWRASVQNGRIDLNKLDEVWPEQFDPDLKGPALAHPEAAEAMSCLLWEARATGHTDLRVKYSYRTLAKQQEKYDDFQAGGNLAASPGTSNHGWAVSFDLTWSQPRSIEWAHRRGARFGFKFDVPSENWHITYQGGFKGSVDNLKFDEFERGVRAFWKGEAEPTVAGPKKFGWNFAERADTRPKAVAGLPDHKHEPGGVAP